MADLGSKATDGRLSFKKYVTDNKRFSEIEYEIEKGRDAVLYTKTGNSFSVSNTVFKAGTKLKIVDSDYVEFNKIKLAKVKIGTKTGYIPINTIRKPTGGNGTQYEDEVVDAFNAYILDAGGKIDIHLKGDDKVYRDISYAVKVDSNLKRQGGVRGDPKADIILCKDKTRPLADGSIYVSHKKEGGPEAFQQYGGVSDLAGPEIYNHPVVQKFLEALAKIIGSGDKLPHPVIGPIEDKKLMCLSIFGPEYGKKFSLQHVQLIGQGRPKFDDKGKYIEVDFTSHMSLSGDLHSFIGDYLPVMGATFRAGRGFEYKGKRYNGARVAIYPKKLMATRSGLVTLK